MAIIYSLTKILHILSSHCVLKVCVFECVPQGMAVLLCYFVISLEIVDKAVSPGGDHLNHYYFHVLILVKKSGQDFSNSNNG